MNVLLQCGASKCAGRAALLAVRSEEHTSELQSQSNLVCRLLLEKKKKKERTHVHGLTVGLHSGPAPRHGNVREGVAADMHREGTASPRDDDAGGPRGRESSVLV